MLFLAAIYRFVISAYFLVVRFAALFNEKAALFVKGRNGLLPKINRALSECQKPRIWMHCASLGEFEQGRPVLEAIKEKYPGFVLVLTFFSPSGYEVRKDYKGADFVFYLPTDSPAHARGFLDIVKPELVIFVKYEFWYFYLSALASRKIPAILVSSVFKKDQPFFKWYGGLHRFMLHCFTHLFVQDKASLQLLIGIGIKEVSISGDTRFDRVIKAASQTMELTQASAFAAGHKVLLAGSTWKQDEEFLFKVMQTLPSGWKLILVPHEVGASHIAEIQKLFEGKAALWSDPHCDLKKRVLVVDKVGLLLQLYRYGTVAWIGGGFDKEGVHNVLEAAVYGLPCFFGPVFHQFIEAGELIEKGGGFTIKSPEDLISCLRELEDRTRYLQHADAARSYVLSHGGATESVTRYVDSVLNQK